MNTRPMFVATLKHGKAECTSSVNGSGTDGITNPDTALKTLYTSPSNGSGSIVKWVTIHTAKTQAEALMAVFYIRLSGDTGPGTVLRTEKIATTDMTTLNTPGSVGRIEPDSGFCELPPNYELNVAIFADGSVSLNKPVHVTAAIGDY